MLVAGIGLNALFFSHANRYETYNLNFHVNFFLIFGVFRPFAAPSKCRPVRPAPPVPRCYATD